MRAKRPPVLDYHSTFAASVLHSFEASALRSGEQGEACVAVGVRALDPYHRGPGFTGENPQGKPHLSLDRFVLSRVHAHINQREASAAVVRFNRDQVLVALGSNFQLH